MTTADLKRLSEQIERMAGRTVLVLGDAMLDHYIWGDALRISPEAPVTVVKVERESQRLGGAANVAHNIASLGSTPLLVAVTGTDQGAQLLRAALTLAVTLQRPVELYGIRASRRPAGLGAEHLAIVRALAQICDAELQGDVIGSEYVSFAPAHPPVAGTYTFDVSVLEFGNFKRLIFQPIKYRLVFVKCLIRDNQNVGNGLFLERIFKGTVPFNNHRLEKGVVLLC